MFSSFFSYISIHYTLLIVIVGNTVVGCAAAAIGVFAVLRRQSLLGDAISHAALPGIALMLFFIPSAGPWLLMCGGGVAGMIGAGLTILISRTAFLKQDTLLGIILSVFFGFGIVLKSIIQKRSIVNQAALGKFFFGNASTLLQSDVVVIVTVSLLVFILIGLLWKECVLFSFDREFAQSLGYNLLFFEFALTVITVLAIVIGLHTVGVLLMSALIIAPAAAARQWVQTVGNMFWLAILFGATSAFCGACLSSQTMHLPTGPAIVVCVSCIVIVSFIAAPSRLVSRGES